MSTLCHCYSVRLCTTCDWRGFAYIYDIIVRIALDRLILFYSILWLTTLLFNPKYHQRDPLPQNDMPRLKLPRGQSISKLHSTSSRSIWFASAALLQQQQQTRKTPSVLRLPQRNKLYLRMSDEVYFWKPIKLDRCSTGHVNVQRLPKGPWI